MEKTTAETILHPTDFSEQSEIAFAHALRIAVENQARLYIFHVHDGPQRDVPWHEYPSVRATLERWNILPKDSPRTAVGKLGIEVEKMVGNDKDVVKSIVGFARRKNVDLLVLGTEDRRGMLSWRSSTAARVVREGQIPTLFVPIGANPCVDWHDGSVDLRRVLVPVSQRPRPRAALARAQQLLESFGSKDSVLTLLHVGDEKSFPLVDIPTDSGCQMEKVTLSGDATRRILEQARSTETDLILMMGEWPKGLLASLRANNSEKVLRGAPCPVLVVPAGVE